MRMYWPPGQKDTGWKPATREGERDGYDMVEYNTVVNAFHYHSLKLMSELGGLSGEKNIRLFICQGHLWLKEHLMKNS